MCIFGTKLCLSYVKLCAIFVVMKEVVSFKKHDFQHVSGNHEISIKHNFSRL